MIKTNLHTHTTFSDGKNTAEEMALAAIEKGFVSLGFSDHSYTPFDSDYCADMQNFDEYIFGIEKLKKSLAGRLTVFCGIELDYYSKGDFRPVTDYIIGSVHYIEKDGIFYQVDYSAERSLRTINEGCDGSSDVYAKKYYTNICRHIEKNSPDIIGHFDLLTLFGTVDETTDEYRKQALLAVDYAVERGCIIEINTGAVFKKLRSHPYPSDMILKRIFEKGGKVTVNSDSHKTESIDFFFDESAKLLKSIGFKSTWNLTENGFKEFEI